MNIKEAKGSWIQLEVIEQEKKKSVLIHNTEEEDFSLAKVLSVGDGVLLYNGERSTSNLQVNDYVLYLKGTGRTITIDGKEYIFCYASSILCTIEL